MKWLWLENRTANLVPAPGTRLTGTGEGEWNITVTVFRDLGIAFGAALFFIYVLLVAQTESLALIIMAAIPLTLIGIMPGFFLLDLLTNRPVAGFPDTDFFHRNRDDRNDRAGRNRGAQFDHSH